MSHSDIMNWILEMQKSYELFESAAQYEHVPIKHSRLRRIGWQLRLAFSGPQPEFVPVSDANFMAKPPKDWRLLMLG